MGFELLCATIIALLFGVLLCFAGYRFFIAILPLWGFLFGFVLGAQTMQALFGVSLLATTTSWVVGFIVGAIFAVLSYFIYIFAVLLLAGSLGYSLGVGIMLALGVNMGFLVWLVGIVLAGVLIVVTLVFNLQKYMIIIATALAGAGMVIGTMMVGVVGMSMAKFLENPIQTVLQNSPWWALLFLVLAGAGFYVQFKAPPVMEVPEELTSD
jgi:hypothetical protein